MFENVVFIVGLLVLIIFQITSIISLKSYFKKNNSLLEKKNHELEKFYEDLENKTQSSMVNKKGDK